MIAYLNGKFIPDEEIKISPFDRGFLFADGIYEVVRSYRGKLFMFGEHLKRMERGLGEIKINFTGLNELEKISYDLIKKNPSETKSDCSLYIQITRGVSFPRKHAFPPSGTKPTIFISLSQIKTKAGNNKDGVKVILSDDFRWSRCDVKTIGLLPAVLAYQNALDDDASESVWVRNNLICEGSHTNFFAVKNGIVVTPPLSKFILPGITRKAVLAICRKSNIPVREEEILKENLKELDEVFITGTLTEINPVVKIDDIKIGNGKPGAVTKRIQAEFKIATLLK